MKSKPIAVQHRMIVEAWEQYWELDFDRRGKVKDFGKGMERGWPEAPCDSGSSGRPFAALAHLPCSS